MKLRRPAQADADKWYRGELAEDKAGQGPNITPYALARVTTALGRLVTHKRNQALFA